MEKQGIDPPPLKWYTHRHSKGDGKLWALCDYKIRHTEWGVHHREGTGSNRQKEGHGFTSQVGTGTRDNNRDLNPGHQVGT